MTIKVETLEGMFPLKLYKYDIVPVLPKRMLLECNEDDMLLRLDSSYSNGHPSFRHPVYTKGTKKDKAATTERAMFVLAERSL